MVPESPILATSIIVVTIEAEHIYLCIVKKSLYFSCISHCHVHNPKYSAQAKAKSSLCNFIPSLHGNEHFINSVEKQNGKAAARLALEEVHVRVFMQIPDLSWRASCVSANVAMSLSSWPLVNLTRWIWCEVKKHVISDLPLCIHLSLIHFDK